MPKRYWRDIRECRDFFNSFAQQRALEPLDPETWYSIDDKEILNTQVYERVRTNQIDTNMFSPTSGGKDDTRTT